MTPGRFARINTTAAFRINTTVLGRFLRINTTVRTSSKQVSTYQVQASPSLLEISPNHEKPLVTVFLTWGLVVAVVGALLAGMMNQLTRSLWTAFLIWWNA